MAVFYTHADNVDTVAKTFRSVLESDYISRGGGWYGDTLFDDKPKPTDVRGAKNIRITIEEV